MRALMGLLLALISGAGAMAQDEIANGARFGDWIVACDAVSTQRTTCRIVQSQTVADTGQLVANFVAYPLAEEEALFVVQVPMGVYLPSGAVYRPEQPALADQREMIWQRCAGNICEAALQLDAAEVAGFADAGVIIFGYQMDPSRDPVLTRVDVSRFAEALQAIRASGD